jgi:hypothetical protein
MLTIEYPMTGADGYESTPAGIIIDFAVYTLQGEPPIARGGNWWTGHVQQ